MTSSLLQTPSMTPTASPVPAACFITTIAGSGALGWGQDDIDWPLIKPTAVLHLPNGDLLISDAASHRVFVARADGSIGVFAGNGDSEPFGGEYGDAKRAVVNAPAGLAWLPDEQGVLIAQPNASRIRVVTSNGIIYTWAGTGDPQSGGDYDSRFSASFATPTSMSVHRDSRDVYVVDGPCVRKIDAMYATVVTVVAADNCATRTAGYASLIRVSGDAQFYEMLFAPAGWGWGNFDFLLTSPSNRTVYLVDSANLNTTALVDGAGPSSPPIPTEPLLGAVYGIAYHAATDRVLLADSSNKRVRSMNSSGFLGTVAGALVGPGSFADGIAPLSARLGQIGGDGPIGVAIDSNYGLTMACPSLGQVKSVASACFFPPSMTPVR